MLEHAKFSIFVERCFFFRGSNYIERTGMGVFYIRRCILNAYDSRYPSAIRSAYTSLSASSPAKCPVRFPKVEERVGEPDTWLAKMHYLRRIYRVELNQMNMKNYIK